MQYFSDARIDYFITEDLPYIDLTCEVLGISGELGEMDVISPARDCVLAGIEVVRRMMSKLGCEVVSARSDGDRIAAGESFMVVRGGAENLHAAWKACLNVFDHLSAVATKTRSMVDAAHSSNPRCEVLTTRKSMNGVKDLLTYAVVIGGAYPHRLGLSGRFRVRSITTSSWEALKRWSRGSPTSKRAALRRSSSSKLTPSTRSSSREQRWMASSSTRCPSMISPPSSSLFAPSTRASRSSRRREINLVTPPPVPWASTAWRARRRFRPNRST